MGGGNARNCYLLSCVRCHCLGGAVVSTQYENSSYFIPFLSLFLSFYFFPFTYISLQYDHNPILALSHKPHLLTGHPVIPSPLDLTLSCALFETCWECVSLRPLKCSGHSERSGQRHRRSVMGVSQNLLWARLQASPGKAHTGRSRSLRRWKGEGGQARSLEVCWTHRRAVGFVM